MKYATKITHQILGQQNTFTNSKQIEVIQTLLNKCNKIKLNMVTKKYSLPAKALIHVYMYFGIKKKIKEKSPFLLHINNNYSLQNKNWETAKAGSGENYTIRCIY